MKKIIMLILCLLILTSCNHESEKQFHSGSDTQTSLETKSMSVSDFMTSKKEEPTTYIAYIERPSCTDCNSFEPELIEYLIKNPSINEILYFVDVSDLYSNEEDWKEFKETYNIQGTPSFIFVKDEKKISSSTWTVERGYTISIFIDWINSINYS